MHNWFVFVWQTINNEKAKETGWKNNPAQKLIKLYKKIYFSMTMAAEAKNLCRKLKSGIGILKYGGTEVTIWLINKQTLKDM